MSALAQDARLRAAVGDALRDTDATRNQGQTDDLVTKVLEAIARSGTVKREYTHRYNGGSTGRIEYGAPTPERAIAQRTLDTWGTADPYGQWEVVERVVLTGSWVASPTVEDA